MRYEKLFDMMVALNDGINNGHALTIKYNNVSRKQNQVRDIIPIQFADGHNVLAFCALRKDYRKFSIENIEWVETSRVLH